MFFGIFGFFSHTLKYHTLVMGNRENAQAAVFLSAPRRDLAKADKQWLLQWLAPLQPLIAFPEVLDIGPPAVHPQDDGTKTDLDGVSHQRSDGSGDSVATPAEVAAGDSGFQLHMTRNHVSPASINCAIVALRFFFKVTLERDDLVRRLTFVHEPRKAPIVLSPKEVARLLGPPPASNTRRRSASPMAQACASPRSSR
jgi:hypothetical protein